MRSLFTFISVLGLLALIGSGLYYGYGFGLQYVHEQLDAVEAQIEEAVEEELLGLESVDVTFTKFYFANNFSGFAMEVDVDHSITLDETRYVTLSMSFEYEEVASIDANSYVDITEFITMDPLAVQSQAIAYAIMASAIWIGFWVLKVFTPKRKK
ncbi:MAG TPA: hypothetical protein VK005_02620 [Acholeplasma sp.]|nr:hypothetical protein [Acholeplasma sp.]